MRGVIPNHLIDEFAFLDSLPVSNPPEPWKLAHRRAIGGLTEVGFADTSELLLIASHSGRGLLDCSQGILVARDDDNDFQFDLGNLLVEGIGPLEGKLIRMAGPSGGD